MEAVLLALQLIASTGPFAIFEPRVHVTAEDRRELEAGKPIIHVLPTRDREVAVFAAIPVAIDGDRLVAWTRDIAALKKSPYVLEIRRFSEPPRLEDLDALTLDDDELAELKDCRPEHCDVKLSAREISDLRAATRSARDWKKAVRAAFARSLLERAVSYVDDEAGEGESFLYWSKERLGRRPIVSITHVNISRGHDPGPEVIVVSKNVFATRYLTASISVTALTSDGARRYLAYVNRSEVDALGGMFGGIVRWFVERRLKSDAEDVLPRLRERLEGGNPGTGGRYGDSGR